MCMIGGSVPPFPGRFAVVFHRVCIVGSRPGRLSALQLSDNVGRGRLATRRSARSIRPLERHGERIRFRHREQLQRTVPRCDDFGKRFRGIRRRQAGRAASYIGWPHRFAELIEYAGLPLDELYPLGLHGR